MLSQIIDPSPHILLRDLLGRLLFLAFTLLDLVTDQLNFVLLAVHRHRLITISLKALLVLSIHRRIRVAEDRGCVEFLSVPNLINHSDFVLIWHLQQIVTRRAQAPERFRHWKFLQTQALLEHRNHLLNVAQLQLRQIPAEFRRPERLHRTLGDRISHFHEALRRPQIA